MTHIPCTEATAPPAAERPSPQARLNELAFRRGWSPATGVDDAIRWAIRSAPVRPDWSRIGLSWTYEPSVIRGDADVKAHVFPTLLDLDEAQQGTISLRYPYPQGLFGRRWCPAHRAPTMTFPLSDQGVDVLEQLLPAIERYRVDDREVAACMAGGRCRAAQSTVA